MMFILFLIVYFGTVAMLIIMAYGDNMSTYKVLTIGVLVGMLFIVITFNEAMENGIEDTLIEDGKICYISDKFGNTEIVLLDSTMTHTFARLYGGGDTTEVKVYKEK